MPAAAYERGDWFEREFTATGEIVRYVGPAHGFIAKPSFDDRHPALRSVCWLGCRFADKPRRIADEPFDAAKVVRRWHRDGRVYSEPPPRPLDEIVGEDE